MNVPFLGIAIDSLAPIIPIILLILLMVTLRKKKKMERERSLGAGLGRRGKKDHLWLIIKDYLKKKSLFGYSIDTAHIFDRPPKQELHTFLKKALIFRTRQEAKEKGVRYVKPDVPKRFPLQDYFDSLEEETMEQNREFLNPKAASRKRYVILFRIRSGNEEPSDWNAIEAEILKKPTKEGGNREVVVINRELDLEKEMGWIEPLLDAREKEKAKRKEG